MGCVFCQNRQISHTGPSPALGRAVSSAEFACICLKLQEMGAENINIVTGSHAVPAIVQGICAARNAGLKLPVLWNSSAYEGLEALALLEETVDVYLPDLKTLDADLARRFFRAPDYPDCAARDILRMLEVRGELRYSGAVLVSGVIIRHLVLPGCLESTRQTLRWFADHAQGRALLSLMTQYTPMKGAFQREDDSPGRFLNEAEYETVLGWLDEFSIEDGFCQGLVTGNGWLPDFSRQNPFSSALSVPVWHWSCLPLNAV